MAAKNDKLCRHCVYVLSIMMIVVAIGLMVQNLILQSQVGRLWALPAVLITASIILVCIARIKTQSENSYRVDLYDSDDGYDCLIINDVDDELSVV